MTIYLSQSLLYQRIPDQTIINTLLQPIIRLKHQLVYHIHPLCYLQMDYESISTQLYCALIAQFTFKEESSMGWHYDSKYSLSGNGFKWTNIQHSCYYMYYGWKLAVISDVAFIKVNDKGVQQLANRLVVFTENIIEGSVYRYMHHQPTRRNIEHGQKFIFSMVI